MVNNKVSYIQYDDYAQSANTLFHFMTKLDYLKTILINKAIIPRYCVENIEYLKIQKREIEFKEVAILQKCFCDIPFHKLGEVFPLVGVGDEFDKLKQEDKAELQKHNTHFDYYGQYAISFSKAWGEQMNLQPVHYINRESDYAKDFSSVFRHIFEQDEVSAEYSQDVINRLTYLKPLRGIMRRKVPNKESDIYVDIYKNFHDEREWRYIPNNTALAELNTEALIANPMILPLVNTISNMLKDKKYTPLWLHFNYNDVRYIIVPDPQSRIEIIKTIMEIPVNNFDEGNDIELQRSILISKILVLSEIRKDW